MTERREDLEEELLRLDKRFLELKTKQTPNLDQKQNHEIIMQMGDIKNEMLNVFWKLYNLSKEPGHGLDWDQRSHLGNLKMLCKSDPTNVQLYIYLKLIAPSFNYFQNTKEADRQT